MAWVSRDLVYSGMSVFITFQKYSRSGTLPFGSLLGKYFMNLASDYMSGQKEVTESSS